MFGLLIQISRLKMIYSCSENHKIHHEHALGKSISNEDLANFLKNQITDIEYIRKTQRK